MILPIEKSFLILTFSLSFGLFIGYVKFPLFEAIERSGEMLFNIAKRANDERKNSVAIELQKHAGQSMRLCFYKEKKDGVDALQEFRHLLKRVCSSTADGEVNKSNEQKETVLLSAAQKLIHFEKLFAVAGTSETSLKALAQNIFDSDFHTAEERVGFLHDELPCFMHKWRESITVHDGEHNASLAWMMAQVLRLIKIYVEKKGERWE